MKVTDHTKVRSNPNKIYGLENKGSRKNEQWAKHGANTAPYKNEFFNSRHAILRVRKPRDRGIWRLKVITRCDKLQLETYVSRRWDLNFFWTWQVAIDSERWILFCVLCGKIRCIYVPEEKGPSFEEHSVSNDSQKMKRTSSDSYNTGACGVSGHLIGGYSSSETKIRKPTL